MYNDNNRLINQNLNEAKNNRPNWEILFFGYSQKYILEIQAACKSPFYFLKARLFHINPDSLKLKDKPVREEKGEVIISSGMQHLPFLDHSLDGLIIFLHLSLFQTRNSRKKEKVIRIFSEIRRILTKDGRVLIFLENRPLAYFLKRHPLKIMFSILKSNCFVQPEVYWPYRDLSHFRRLIPMNAKNVERYFIKDITILNQSKGNMITFFKYLLLTVLLKIKVFEYILPKGYFIFLSPRT